MTDELPSDQHFFAIVDENDGIYLVYKDTRSLELISIEDVAYMATVLGVNNKDDSRIDLLYRVAAKIGERLYGGRKLHAAIEDFRAKEFRFNLCLPLSQPVSLTVGRGRRTKT